MVPGQSAATSATGMTVPYEVAAKNGDEMPDGLEYPDQILFLQLRLLYKTFKMGVIDKATAVKEKKQLFTEYQAHKINWSMCDQWCEVIKRTELARAEFRKNPSMEAAERLVAAVEGKRIT
jgi:hypothetical protein